MTHHVIRFKPYGTSMGSLKRKVEEKKPRNIAQLKEVIQDEWMSISSATCAHLVDSVSRRLDAVISSNDSHTKY